MLIACCPAGAMSNTYCYLIRGNTSLSVRLTAASNVAATVLTPVSLAVVYGMLAGQGATIQFIPAGFVARELVFTMLLSIIIGAGLRAGLPAWVAGHQRLLRSTALISIAALLVLVIGIAVLQRPEPIRFSAAFFIVQAAMIPSHITSMNYLHLTTF